MKLGHSREEDKGWTIAGVIAVAVIVFLGIPFLPDLHRYLRLRNI